MIQIICKILEGIVNPLIGFLSLLEIGLFLVSLAMFISLHSEIVKLNEPLKRKKKVHRLGRGKYNNAQEVQYKKDWQEFDDYLKKYDSRSTYYNVYSQIIQLFPLLGILGTVVGLFVSMNAKIDPNQIAEVAKQSGISYEGMGFALTSTIYGIIAAVVFKVLDVFLVAFFLNRIDNEVDRYEKNFNVDASDVSKDSDE